MPDLLQSALTATGLAIALPALAAAAGGLTGSVGTLAIATDGTITATASLMTQLSSVIQAIEALRSQLLKTIFRSFRSRPVSQLIEQINPILRGWVHYFSIGHSSRCFGYIRDWVEKKIRRHLARAAQRQGFGWKRWSREWLYGTLGLFYGYRVSHPQSSSAAAPS